MIRRFIEPDAAILYVAPERVLATVLINGYHLGDNPALVRLARIVHDADISEDLQPDPLGPGLLAIGMGDLEVEADDHRLLHNGSFVYDALYAWSKLKSKP